MFYMIIKQITKNLIDSTISFSNMSNYPLKFFKIGLLHFFNIKFIFYLSFIKINIEYYKKYKIAAQFG